MQGDYSLNHEYTNHAKFLLDRNLVFSNDIARLVDIGDEPEPRHLRR
jgi:hypothetical protein